VNDISKIELRPLRERELEAELCALAVRLDSAKRSLVHRDLQSQNVMVRDEEPILIDFQGMRFGSFFYDLGSLLCDPYVVFSESEINELLSFYYKLSEQELDWPAFCGCFWDASVQRLMQALGAYGFLGATKGLTAFLTHIPAGLTNLRRAVSHAPLLPLLSELSQSCFEAIEKNNLPLRAEENHKTNTLLDKRE
jgi:aminoglycoside/choline kinase family phosphotransferase